MCLYISVKEILKLKILIVNAFDIAGGAARAAYRLHRALVDTDVNSEMLVIGKFSDDYTVTPYEQNFGRIQNRLRNLQKRVFKPLKPYPNKSETLFSPAFLSFSKVVETINAINPDIVHLHWICQEMIRIEDLAAIEAPIVWSLHDMWAFTGGCHYDEECGQYKASCGQCKVLASIDENDLSKQVFERKLKTYAKLKSLTIVGLSHWLADCAAKSTLFKNNKIVVLPNPIDIDQFKPIDKTVARTILSLPQNKKLVLFGAMSATSDPRKGFLHLLEAINQLETDNIELVVFGSSKPKVEQKLKYPVHYLGQLQDNISLQLVYSACDVMVAPSLQENLSNTIMECLSCATPVVAFAIGGNGDLVTHKKNGYLAIPFDDLDLVNGIEWLLNYADYEGLCSSSQNKVIECFASSMVAQQYIELYKSICDCAQR